MSARQLRAFETPILSARVGDNAGLIRDAVDLYLADGARVCDPTYGQGNFWKKIESDRFDLVATDMADGGPDARRLPYEDATFDAVVLDPPYIPSHDGDLKASIDKSYRVNGSGLRSARDVSFFYWQALCEAERVVWPKGVIFVKCQDTTENHRAWWIHNDVLRYGEALDLDPVDLFVLVQRGAPAQRHRSQERARRNHSYLWVFRRTRSERVPREPWWKLRPDWWEKP